MKTLLPLLAVLLVCSCRKTTQDPTLLPGYLEADLIQMASPEGGYLEKLAVRRGETVAAGQELFRLDAAALDLTKKQAAAAGEALRLRAEDSALGEREENIRRLRANLAAEEARLTLARTEYDRYRALSRSAAVSDSAIQERAAVLKQTEENRNAIQAQLDLAGQGQRPKQIAALAADQRAAEAAAALTDWHGAQVSRRAGEAAVVQDTLFEPGEWVPPGRPVVVLRRMNDLRARFFVAPEVLAQLRLGQEVEVLPPGDGAPLRAAIVRLSDQPEYTPPVIYSREESQRLVFLVEALLPTADAARLHPGLPVSIRLPAAK